ncbi:hypothetical protein [Rhodopirellula sp. MGV]|uniref:hypothetical protein n=1 Tax=Rhodopirellula sp. MGV TaxID=2023130 RepID=UPI00117B0ACB|nr:hypothetical protein [Rhodopirellula sp. MGV]
MRKPLLAMFACLATAASSFAADVTTAIPSDAYGFVVVPNAEQLDGKVQMLSKRMHLPIPSVLTLLTSMPDLNATLDQDGSLAIALMPSGNRVAPLVYVPVDDYQALIEQLTDASTEDGITEGSFNGNTLALGKVQGHAVVTQASDRAVLASALQKIASGGEAVTKPSGDFDLAMVATEAGLVRVTEVAQEGLSEMIRVIERQSGPDNPAIAGLRMYEKLFVFVKSDLQSIAVTMRLDESSSLRVTKSFVVKPDSEWAPVLKSIPASEQDLLVGLPDIPFVIAAGVSIPGGGFEKMLDLSKTMMQSMPQLYHMTPSEIDKMMELSREYFSNIEGMSFLMGAGEGDMPIYGQMAAAMTVPDSDQYLDDYVKYWKEVREITKDSDQSFIAQSQFEEMTVKDHRVLRTIMPAQSIPGFPAEQQAAMEG